MELYNYRDPLNCRRSNRFISLSSR